MFSNYYFLSCCGGGGCGCHSEEDMNAGCGSSCGDSCGEGCGCGGGSQGEAIRIQFDDGTEYDCPVLSIFEINDQEYIALYHPERQKALLYRFMENFNGVVLESIEDEEEFNTVANAFRNL